MITESPCNGICQLNHAELCVGCGRSRMEIGGWTRMSDGEKAALRAQLDERLRNIQATVKP